MAHGKAISRIAVYGPGMMGHAIAQEFVAAGYEVTLCGRSEERLEEAHSKIESSLHELARWELISEDSVEPALNRLTMTTDLEAAGSNADFIVESIVEVLEAKEELFSKLDAVCPQHTIFASNTSSLLPSTLAAATQRRDRFLVAHYFNPPYLMPLNHTPFYSKWWKKENWAPKPEKDFMSGHLNLRKLGAKRFLRAW